MKYDQIHTYVVVSLNLVFQIMSDDEAIVFSMKWHI